MNKRRIAVVLALLLMVGAMIALPGTVAYITAKSNTISNTFTAPHFTPDAASVKVQIKKIVHNVGSERMNPKGFQFELLGDNHEKFVLTADYHGNAEIILPYEEADIGKTFTYKVYEINDRRADVIYDRTVYELTIDVQLDEVNNAVKTVVKVNGEMARPVFTFENTYSADSAVPMTGDSMNLSLCIGLMLISAAGMLLLGRRKA